MIPPQIPQMLGELYQCNMLSDQGDRMKAVRQWWDKWVKKLQVSHTYDREHLEQFKSSKREFREHCHRKMFAQVAEELFKSKFACLEEDFHHDPENPHPFLIEDRLTVLFLGAK